jgi:hypothetical protein
MDRLELPVFTSVFRLRRRLYRIYDVELPVPVSLAQAALFAGAAFTVFGVLQAAGVPLSPGSAWAYLVPPGLAAWLGNRRLSDERTPLEWAGAQLRHAVEPRSLTALAPARPARAASLHVRVWTARRRRDRRR